jgi:hypothetical protein
MVRQGRGITVEVQVEAGGALDAVVAAPGMAQQAATGVTGGACADILAIARCRNALGATTLRA